MRPLVPLFVCALSGFALAGCVRHAVDPRLLAAPDPGSELPPGIVVVEVVSAKKGEQWTVRAGKRELCRTPCLEHLRPNESLLMHSDDGERLRVNGFGVDAAQTKRVVVVAEGTHVPKKVNGIVFTTLGGMGVVTAITLGAVGCSDLPDRRGLCNAGLITGGVSVPLTAAAIWMLVDSAPKVHVLPVPRSGRKRAAASVTVLPGAVAGTF